MIRHIAVLALVLSALGATAQKKTEYFANGNKKFEGNYHWAWNSFDGRDHVNFDDNDKKKAIAVRNAELSLHTESLPAKVFDGKCTFYYENGKVAYTGSYTDGAKDGMFTYYYSDGSRQAECGYKAGMPDGEWKKWMPDGKPASVCNYRCLSDAELDTLYTHRIYDNPNYNPFRDRGRHPATTPDSLRNLLTYWYTQRRDAEAMLNRNAHWDGDQTFYYENGKPCMDMHFDNDVRTGTWHYKDAEGKVMAEVIFTNGVVTGGFNNLKQEVRKAPPTRELMAAIAAESAAREPSTGIDPGTVPQGVAAAPLPPSASNAVYNYVEQMPAAQVDVQEYFATNMRYPEAARNNAVQGRVIMKFVVNEDGSLSDIQVLRGIGAGCDDEATRLLKNMPRWKPGKQNGQPVKTYFTLPVQFKL
jgi:TonB family protein